MEKIEKVKIAVNGYGTIGTRIADAVEKQDDMQIVGICKRTPNYDVKVAVAKGIPIYAAEQKNISDFENAGIKVEGTIEDLLDKADLVVDCTPAKVGSKTKQLYEIFNVKAIFQGGEKAELTGLSFNSFLTYNKCFGADYVRVVSCNTTGLCRTLYPINEAFGIQKGTASLVRRAADQKELKKGLVDSIKPVLALPSHHGPDLETVDLNINLYTMAVAVPTTKMHLHMISIDLKKDNVKSDDVIKIWEETPRVRFVEGSMGVQGTSQIMDLARMIGKPPGDFNEIILWKEGIAVKGNVLLYYQAIHQESDVVPENIDCIRAMLELEKESGKSIEKTDNALEINKPYQI